MTRDLIEIEFRAITENPSTPGWYYGRAKSHDGNPFPRYISARFGDELSVDLHTSSSVGRLDEFEWFGPVREVREASRP